MTILLLALIGVLVGLGLDGLVARLAVAPYDDEEEEDALDRDGDDDIEEEEPAPELPRSASLHAEAGALVVPEEHSDWLRRTLIVAATAGLFAGVAHRYDDPSHMAVVTAYMCVLVICAATDIISFRVPNVVTYPAILGAIVVAVFMPGAKVWEALAGGALAGGLLFIPAVITGGRGMGMGDVKLALFVGLAVGIWLVWPAMVYMALTGGLAAVALLITRARKRGEPIPYAPFVALGGAATMLLQGTVFVDLVI